MPPIPPTFDPSALASIAAIERRQHDLSEFQIPRLRTCKDSLTVQQQYAAELRDDLDALAQAVEALEESIEDQHGEKARRDLRGIVEGFKATLTGLRKEFRSALLTSKRAIDTNNASKREELLRSSVMREKQTSSEKTAEDALAKTNNDITDALRRTMGVMQGELERSVLSVQMLESSTATLTSTTATHDMLTGLLGTSKQLITALEKSDWLDRLLILAALAFFFVVVLFILKQRIVDRGVRIAFWWTRFVPGLGGGSGKGISGALTKLEEGLRTTSPSDAAAVVSSAVTAAASVASSALPKSGSAVMLDGTVLSGSPSGSLSGSLEQLLQDITYSPSDASAASTPTPTLAGSDLDSDGEASTSGDSNSRPTAVPGVSHDEL
ncbi:Sec20-domain-containing protein [Dentipellis sp. KUC8613]|nr:Sec20-domain-containing protein [Dentipellis sp. KUC8613]